MTFPQDLGFFHSLCFAMIFANPTCFKRILPGGEGAEGKTAQDGPKTTQEAPKTAQEATKKAQEAPKTAQEAPKTAPRRGPWLLGGELKGV